MPDTATTMIAIGETSRASTAACPTISAPMIDTVSPTGFGSRRPASCSSAKATSMPTSSAAVEKGTSFFASMIDSSSRVGIISGWKAATAA